jgi:hypothetical protein
MEECVRQNVNGRKNVNERKNGNGRKNVYRKYRRVSGSFAFNS